LTIVEAGIGLDGVAVIAFFLIIEDSVSTLKLRSGLDAFG